MTLFGRSRGDSAFLTAALRWLRHDDHCPAVTGQGWRPGMTSLEVRCSCGLDDFIREHT